MKSQMCQKKQKSMKKIVAIDIFLDKHQLQLY